MRPNLSSWTCYRKCSQLQTQMRKRSKLRALIGQRKNRRYAIILTAPNSVFKKIFVEFDSNKMV